ncbi:MAG: 2-oxo acid dehydrogenase subunit E2, partial [Myxococcota bacterium]|nr:2-oxo acid dehydrogenase subunit E2 [Myxococcota bacterium]
LKLISFLQYELNIDTTRIGVPRDPFGSALVSSVGMLGIGTAYAPFFPLSRAPLVVLVGATEDRVVAEGGEPVVRKVLTLNATCDHRVIDGFHGAVIAREVKELLEHPERLEQDCVPDVEPSV